MNYKAASNVVPQTQFVPLPLKTWDLTFWFFRHLPSCCCPIIGNQDLANLEMSHWLLRGGKCSKRIGKASPKQRFQLSKVSSHCVCTASSKGPTLSDCYDLLPSFQSGLFPRHRSSTPSYWWNIEQDWFFKIVTFKQLSPLLNITGQRWWNMLINMLDLLGLVPTRCPKKF